MWLRQLQALDICDLKEIRHFLNIKELKSSNLSTKEVIQSPLKVERITGLLAILDHCYQQKLQIQTNLNQTDDNMRPFAIPTEPIDMDLPFPYTIASDNTKIYNSGDEYNITWKGTSYEDFEFLDLRPEAKALYGDCR